MPKCWVQCWGVTCGEGLQERARRTDLQLTLKSNNLIETQINLAMIEFSEGVNDYTSGTNGIL